MNPLEFVHQELRTPVWIYPSEIYAVFFAPTYKSTVLLSRAGASVRVTCSVEEALEKINAAKNVLPNKPEEGKN